MLDVGSLVPTVAGLEADLTDVFKLDPSPAVQHVVHLELEIVGVIAAGTAARFLGTDDVREDLALAGLYDAEIPVLEVGPETD